MHLKNAGKIETIRRSFCFLLGQSLFSNGKTLGMPNESILPGQTNVRIVIVLQTKWQLSNIYNIILIVKGWVGSLKRRMATSSSNQHAIWEVQPTHLLIPQLEATQPLNMRPLQNPKDAIVSSEVFAWDPRSLVTQDIQQLPNHGQSTYLPFNVTPPPREIRPYDQGLLKKTRGITFLRQVGWPTKHGPMASEAIEQNFRIGAVCHGILHLRHRLTCGTTTRTNWRIIPGLGNALAGVILVRNGPNDGLQIL